MARKRLYRSGEEGRRMYAVTVHDRRFPRAGALRLGEFTSMSAAKKEALAAIRESIAQYGGKRDDYEFVIVPFTQPRYYEP